jgi:hypothetical protein
MSSSGVKRSRDYSDARPSDHRSKSSRDLHEEGGLPYGDVYEAVPDQNKKQKSWRDEYLNEPAAEGSHGSRHDRDRSYRSREKDFGRDRDVRRHSKDRYPESSHRSGYDRRDDRDRGRYDRDERREDRHRSDRERGSSRRRDERASE